MMPLPPLAPDIRHRLSARLGRDHYVRFSTCDYSVHPKAIGRRIEVTRLCPARRWRTGSLTAARLSSKSASCACARSWPSGALTAGPRRSIYHLSENDPSPPSISTVWRILRRRGFITPQPHNRPKSSYIRFEASLPNECWQSDVTFWELADNTKVEILNFLDDFSRVCVASKVLVATASPDVVATLYEAGGAWGLPASLLSDNGCIYTAAYRGGFSALESELFHLGIVSKHSRPYHPQTCGKVERFHQTLKRFLAKQPKACSIKQLQGQVDRFAAYYNAIRPHRAKGRMTPCAAFDSRDQAKPCKLDVSLSKELRVRHDKVDTNGSVTIRYRSKLHHIGMGRALKQTRLILLVAGRDIRVLNEQEELLRELTLDPHRDYQPRGTA